MKREGDEPKTSVIKNQKQPKFTSQNTDHMTFQILSLNTFMLCFRLDYRKLLNAQLFKPDTHKQM